MKVLHQIGDRSRGGNFNTLEEILAYDGPISFDGVYESVWDNLIILNDHDRNIMRQKEITFFFCHDHLGKDNSFDIGQPLSNFCIWDKVKALAITFNAKIGYHGKSHLSCTGLRNEAIMEEVIPPHYYSDWCKEYNQKPILAWPYGDVDVVCDLIARMFYDEAYSVYPKGDNSQFQKHRYFLNWDVYNSNGELALKAFV